jgi:prepilin-type N-terminal cleavage/methylation domain-containing protein
MWPKLPRDDAGMTLPELLVAMMLLGIVATITYSALFSSYDSVGRIDDEFRGMTDVKIVVERLSRDLRAARGVEPSPVSNANTLAIWIDKNSDYRRSDAEIITWKIVGATMPGQFDVVREDQTGAHMVVGRSVVSNIGFSYSGPDTGGTPRPNATVRTNLVAVTLSYDAVLGRYSTAKAVGFEVRMRNVP